MDKYTNIEIGDRRMLLSDFQYHVMDIQSYIYSEKYADSWLWIKS